MIMLVTAIAALAGAAVAYAATSNTYTAAFAFKENGTGTKKKPVALSFTENLTAANTVSGDRAAPLIDIKVTLANVGSNYKDFPTCSTAKILAAKNDTVCPKGALVASGDVTAELGDPTLVGAGTPCTPILDVWNAGGGNLSFFFVVEGTHQCGGLQTGSTAPWVGTAKFAGGKLIQDIPLPPDVSTSAGNIPNAYGSLTLENLHWGGSVKVKGKSVPFLYSTGCTKNARAYSVQFTATDSTGANYVSTVTGSDKC